MVMSGVRGAAGARAKPKADLFDDWRLALDHHAHIYVRTKLTKHM